MFNKKAVLTRSGFEAEFFRILKIWIIQLTAHNCFVIALDSQSETAS